MPQCSVAGCGVAAGQGGVRLFPLPASMSERKKWIQFIGRSEKWDPPASACVCSRHFTDGKPTTENPTPTLVYKTGQKIYKVKKELSQLESVNLKRKSASNGFGGESSCESSSLQTMENRRNQPDFEVKFCYDVMDQDSADIVTIPANQERKIRRTYSRETPAKQGPSLDPKNSHCSKVSKMGSKESKEKTDALKSTTR